MRLIPIGEDFKTKTEVREWFDNNYPFSVNDPSGELDQVELGVVIKNGDIVRKYKLLEWCIPYVTLRYNSLKCEVNVLVSDRNHVEQELSRKYLVHIHHSLTLEEEDPVS